MLANSNIIVNTNSFAAKDC